MTAPQAQLAAALADRYVIEGLLGAGGMAHVWLARESAMIGSSPSRSCGRISARW